MFISKRYIPISLEGDDVPYDQRNIIFIPAKMNFKIKGAVQRELMKIQVEAGQDGNVDGEFTVSIGDQQLALLLHNVKEWRGPAFEGVTCNRNNIGNLDPSEPLVLEVLREIDERNQAPKAEPRNEEEAKDPNDLDNAG